MIDKNPCADCRRNDEVKRERYLNDRELPALLSALDGAADQQAANVLRLLLLTGCRKGEALGLEWNHLDLEGGTWTKPSTHTKQRRSHRIPLSGPATELLRKIHDDGVTGPYVFLDRRTGLPRGHIDKAWARIIKAAGITDLRPHDLRHSYASMLVNSGLSLPTIGRLLGHSSPSVTHRYSHLQDSSLREATERVGRLIEGAEPRGKIIKHPRG
jgi:integrase